MALQSARLRRALTSLSSLHRSLYPPALHSSPPISRISSSSSIQSSVSLLLQSRSFTGSRVSLLSSGKQYKLYKEGDEITEDTVLFEGCDFNHWLITVDFPKDPAPTHEEMVATYERICAQGLNISIEEAKKKIYACSTTTYQGFQAVMTEEESERFRDVPGVVFILPDSYIDPQNKQYGGDKYENGVITPRPPPIQYRKSPGRFDRPRNDQPGRPTPNRGNPNYNQQAYPQSGGQYGAQQSYPPQGGGSSGAQQRYPPQGGGQYGAQQSYPPQGGGSSGAQQRYPPQGGGNYGAQQRYPPQGGGNHGAQQNYPPQGGWNNGAQQSYPQGGGRYGAHQGNTPQAGGNYGAQQGNTPQAGGNYGAQQGNTPQAGGNYGAQQGNTPQAGGNYGAQQSYPPRQNHGQGERMPMNNNNYQENRGGLYQGNYNQGHQGGHYPQGQRDFPQGTEGNFRQQAQHFSPGTQGQGADTGYRQGYAAEGQSFSQVDQRNMQGENSPYPSPVGQTGTNQG